MSPLLLLLSSSLLSFLLSFSSLGHAWTGLSHGPHLFLSSRIPELAGKTLPRLCQSKRSAGLLQTTRVYSTSPGEVPDLISRLDSLMADISAVKRKITAIEYILLKRLTNKDTNIDEPPGVSNEVILYSIYSDQKLSDLQSDLQKEKNILLGKRLLKYFTISMETLSEFYHYKCDTNNKCFNDDNLKSFNLFSL